VALTLADLDPAWVTALCHELAGPAIDPADVVVRSFTVAPLPSQQGVLSRYPPAPTEARDDVLTGHRALTVDARVAGVDHQHRLVLKAKPPGAVVRQRLAARYRLLDARLADAQQRVSPSILDDCHTRELHVYALERPSLRAITPGIARVWLDPDRQIFAVVMQRFEGVRHEHTLDDLDAWRPDELACVLAGLAAVHGDLLGQLDPAAPPPWLLPFARLHNASLLAYQAELLRYNADTFPELFTPARRRQLEALLAASAARHRAILARPLTLLHGDFSPRNVCLAPAPRGAWRLCAYDWELAQVHLPARDVCELLCYALSPARGFDEDLAARLLDGYRQQLALAAARPISRAELAHDLGLALAELAGFKLLVQGVTHQLLGNRRYFERLVHNTFHGLAAFPSALSQEPS
jgi:hydroxymethylglutaryl-CoA reductase (NADPH)